MEFRYRFEIKKLPSPVDHRKGILLLGSCFTENIGEKLKKYKFSVLENPHGILFNPISVAEAIEDYVNQKSYDETELFSLNEGWHSWKHHSRFSALTKIDALGKINDSIAGAHSFLKNAGHLVITLGSAWVYTLTEEALNAKPGSVAANNHKAPANWFKRRLLNGTEVSEVLRGMVELLQAFNPSLTIIFTISPVRHLRDGAVENSRSKAVLVQAVHDTIAEFDALYYFPSYELVLDDLRDYRFYAEDLVHPNYFATQYVWERLTEACMTGETRALIDDIHSINLAFQHKPFNPGSGQHKKFLQVSAEKVRTLQAKYPFLDFRKEMEYFEK